MAFTAIVGNPDLLLKSDVEKAVLESFGYNPEPLLAALGLATPAMPAKSFVEIMTAPCALEKAANPIGLNRHSKPIGFASEARMKHQTLSSVGFAPEPQVFPEHSIAQSDTSPVCQDDDGNSFTRCRDDAPVAFWDGETGEFRKPIAKTPTVQSAAVREIERRLSLLSNQRLKK